MIELSIGNFEDFLATLTPDVIEQIFSDAKLKSDQVLEAYKFSRTSCSGEQVSAITFTCSLELLALYHKWIETEFGKAL